MISDRIETQTLWDTQVVTSTISEKDSETISVIVIKPQPSVFSALYTSRIVLSTDVVMTSYGVTTIDGTTSTTTWTVFATPTASPSASPTTTPASSVSAWTHTAVPALAGLSQSDDWASPVPRATVTAIGGGSVFGSASGGSSPAASSSSPVALTPFGPAAMSSGSSAAVARADVGVALALGTSLVFVLAVGF